QRQHLGPVRRLGAAAVRGPFADAGQFAQLLPVPVAQVGQVPLHLLAPLVGLLALLLQVRGLAGELERGGLRLAGGPVPGGGGAGLGETACFSPPWRPCHSMSCWRNSLTARRCSARPRCSACSCCRSRSISICTCWRTASTSSWLWPAKAWSSARWPRICSRA